MQKVFRWFWIFQKEAYRGGEIQPEEIFADTLGRDEFDAERLERSIEFGLTEVPFRIGIIAAAFGILTLLARVSVLQIAWGQEFSKRAENNHVFSVLMPAPRGIIFDRNMKELARNTPVFEAVLQPSELPDTADERVKLLHDLAATLNLPESELTEAGFDPAKEKVGFKGEIILARDISREAVVELQSRPGQFPGAVVRERELREYLGGAAFLHTIGYVGKVSEAEIKEKPDYAPSDLIGKTGVEAIYERELRGTAGRRLVEVDANYVPVGDLPKLDPIVGKSLVLNIDAGLQRVLYDSLLNELRAAGKTAGSAVAIDPRNGAVRALVSLPSFDPNIFRERISSEDFKRMFLASSKPFFNRSISGEYPSGSVIKPLVAVAALEENIIDPLTKIYDRGFISVPNPYRPGEETIFPDWRAHGLVDMRSAIQWSANVYFYIVGGGYKDIQGLGIRRLGEYMNKFGFGSVLGIDLPAEAEGLVPGPDTIVKTRPKDPLWRIGDTYQTSIGQGSFQATPLQIAALTATVANGGTLWRPQMLNAILDANGNREISVVPEVIRKGFANPHSFEIVREGMRLVATEGTAQAFFSRFPVEVAGKTGTAQTGFLQNTHAWFTAFAPYRNPELALVVMAEDVQANTGIATRITRNALYWYFTEGQRRN